MISPGTVLPPPFLQPKEGGKKEEEVSANQGRVMVDLPAQAKVFVDGHLMKTNATPRVFATPVLQRGQTYFYDIKAELVRDGQTISENQRVFVRPGQVTRVSFGDMTRATAVAQNIDPE